MGVQQTVEFASEIPSWESVRDWLGRKGYELQLRMVGTELTYPNELPPDNWSEIRVGRSEGMITIRRSDKTLTFVTWGDADLGLTQLYNAVTWAFAEVGAGTLHNDAGTFTPEQFRQSAPLPDALKT